MKKPQSLEKKIISYTAIATGLLAMGANTQGQIIYHDVNPDVTLTGSDSLNLDINNDGIIDFTLYHMHVVYGANVADVAMLTPKDTNKILSSGSYLQLLDLNDRISNNENVWGTSGTFIAKGMYSGAPFESGHWVGGVTDKFAGFRFAKNGNWYYGWARFDVAADAKSFKIKDWGYNSFANSPIKAGQQTSSINEGDKNHEISVYLNNKTLIIKQKKDISENVNIHIYNAAGQEIIKTNLVNNQAEINLIDTVPGLYIVRIDSQKGSSSHKIILQ